jgi:hypothetical protein
MRIHRRQRPWQSDGTAKVSFDGVAYFPKQTFLIFGSAALTVNSPTVGVIAD